MKSACNVLWKSLALKRFILLLCVWMIASGASRGSIVVSIAGSLLQSSQNQPLAPGSLLQLVNLGADGVFNLINLSDGGSQWVSGDDALLSAVFTTGSGTAGDFASTNGFDLFKGADTQGRLDRVFEFEENVLPFGAKIGIRWFPGLQASQFASIALVAGQSYGQFTRQQNPLHGGDLWIVPGSGANLAFDPMVTQSAGGSDPEAFGFASRAVIPEPGAAALALAGLLVVGLRLRRIDQSGWSNR